MSINRYGFMRVATCAPNVKVADCDYNVSQIKEFIDKAVRDDVQLLVFPELSITSVSCGDLFFQDNLQRKAIESLELLAEYIKNRASLIIIVGLPLRIDSLLFNVAALVSSEGVLGFVPKTNISNNYFIDDTRWFASLNDLPTSVVMLGNKSIPIGSLIFRTPFANIGVEVGSDLLLPFANSHHLATNGADIICNTSANAAQMGVSSKLRSLVSNQSERLISGYVYSSSGVGESSTDVVFSGNCFIAECGDILKESNAFNSDNELIISDLDIQSLSGERLRNGHFNSKYYNSKFDNSIIHIDCNLGGVKSDELYRYVDPLPFIPSGSDMDNKYKEAFNIQVHGLAKRLKHTGVNKVTIGISGGLDSTLALLVVVKTYDILKLPRENIYGITMPGFGTTSRTYNNAVDLMKELGITNKEISIKDAVTQHFKDIDHDSDIHDLTYENSQARERTQILMDYAGKIGGLVVGTGNMSELALGWATYNGDHMSMYAVNAGVPKTLVKSITKWVAKNEYLGLSQKVILDIVNTPYSPELLPADDKGDIAQKTEHFIGPYELHDFFLYRMLRFGDNPLRISYISKKAFKDMYEETEIKKWLKVFYSRFFSQQFKRSCMPDSSKVVSVSLSPRAGLTMPSDAVVDLWLKGLEIDL